MLQLDALYNPQEVVIYLWKNGMSYKSIAIAIGRSRSCIMAIANGTRNGQRCQRALSILYQLHKGYGNSIRH